MSFFDFFNKKKKNESTRKNNEPIPDDAIVFVDHSNGVGAMSGREMNDFIMKFQNSIGSLIVNHIEGMKRALNHPASNDPLNKVIELKNDIQYVITEKMQLVLNDGRSHSKAVTDKEKTVLINVTCIKCTLPELREKYEQEAGPYLNLLGKYLFLAQQSGITNLVHIIYCYSSDADQQAVTAAYINLSNSLFVKPNELHSFEL